MVAWVQDFLEQIHQLFTGSKNLWLQRYWVEMWHIVVGRRGVWKLPELPGTRSAWLVGGFWRDVAAAILLEVDAPVRSDLYLCGTVGILCWKAAVQ